MHDDVLSRRRLAGGLLGVALLAAGACWRSAAGTRRGRSPAPTPRAR